MPWTIVGGMIAYRKSWFEEVGASSFPDTWEKYQEVGKKLKAKGRPIGQTLGHTFGDAPTFSYPFMWSFGGKEVDESGKVVINSKETIDSVKFMTGFWKDAHDEGGLAWDDTNNNRAFLSQTISATLNGASIYIESLRNPDKYITEKGAQLKTDILHAPLPKGPAGQFSMHTYFSHVLPKYSKNEKAAKDFLKWVALQARVREVVRLAEGLRHAAGRGLGEAQGVGRGSGHDPLQGGGPPGSHARLRRPRERQGGRGAFQVHRHRHVREGRAGHAAEEAVKWADAELKKVYG